MKLGEKSIEYKISGDSGEVLVCLPELGCDLDLFTPFRHKLSSKFKLLQINHRGFGNSISENQDDYKILDLAYDVLQLLKILEIESFSLIGISMGGFVAQEIMKLRPSGLKSVALLCTTGGEDLIKQNRAATEFFETNLEFINKDVPVFIGHGENDRIVPVENSKKLTGELKNSTHVIYPKTDHFFFWEVSSHLNTDLETFFMENAI